MTTRRTATDAGWSFSLRSYTYDREDSSSDSDVSEEAYDSGHQCNALSGSEGNEKATKRDPGSKDDSILEELDIASRNDTATYKPNPWSIAKANASTRPKLVTPSTHRPGLPQATTARKDRSPRPTVLDLLRKPSKRPAASNALSKPQVPPKRQLHGQTSILATPRSDDAHVPSDETLVDDNSDNQDCLSKPSENPSAVNTLVPLGLRPPRAIVSSHGGKPVPEFCSVPPNTSLPRDISPPKPSSSNVSTYLLPDTAHIFNLSGSAAHPQSAAQFPTKATPKRDLRSMLFQLSERAHDTHVMSASPHNPPPGPREESNKFIASTSMSGVFHEVNVFREQYF
ncbi:hypothetical protein C8Q80DRAFT_780240 [Daedaleopsis nitida]|nr:hypothetical protein C8Q80DRAFT_780240 [Daedaleopsis nitida]